MLRVMLLTLVVTAACSPIMPLRPDGGADGGSELDAGSTAGGSAQLDGGLSGQIIVEPVIDQRSRLGARSTRGFRPWRGGVAVIGGALVWVENGTAPGLYRMPIGGCAGAAGCPEQLATMTRPSVFAALDDSVLVADVTTLRRYGPGGATSMVATGSSELVTLATDGAAAFWTTESAPILKTPFGGSTSTIINSNGTPYAMTVAGDRVQWVGVDISGLQAVMQSIRTNGTGAREERRSGNGFQTLKGDGRYLYFARDSAPSTVIRQTVSNGNLEVVAANAQGVTDFALDQTHAWWVEPGTPGLANGRLRRVAHESTQAETIAEAIPLPVGVTVFNGVAFVLAAGTASESYADGKILRVTVR